MLSRGSTRPDKAALQSRAVSLCRKCGVCQRSLQLSRQPTSVWQEKKEKKNGRGCSAESDRIWQKFRSQISLGRRSRRRMTVVPTSSVTRQHPSARGTLWLDPNSVSWSLGRNTWNNALCLEPFMYAPELREKPHRSTGNQQTRASHQKRCQSGQRGRQTNPRPKANGHASEWSTVCKVTWYRWLASYRFATEQSR